MRLAPEDLVAVFGGKAGGWVFVGRSGAVYEAERPLGPFIRSASPPEPMRKVAAAAGAVIGIDGGGHLQKSADAAMSWTVVGPSDRFFTDLVLTERGTAVALAIPEELWSSHDSGSRWGRGSAWRSSVSRSFPEPFTKHAVPRQTRTMCLPRGTIVKKE